VNLSCAGRGASRVNALKTPAPLKNPSLKWDGSPDQARQRRGTGGMAIRMMRAAAAQH
jgi:hypothetical protein